MAPPKKTTETRRADAEAAIEADRKNPTPSFDELREMLQGAEAEKAEMLSQIAEMRGDGERLREELSKTQRSMGDMFEILESLRQQIKNNPTDEGMRAPRIVQMEVLLQCEHCRQPIKNKNGKGICSGVKEDHVLIRVMPKMTMLWSAFQGIKRNGQRYFGYCYVPKAMVDDIMANIGIWEQYKLQLKMPKKFNLGGDYELSKIRGTSVPFMQ